MTKTIDALVKALEAEKEMRLYGKLPECGKEQESLLERRRAVYEATDAALAQARAEQAEPVAWRTASANPPGGFVIFQQYPQALSDLGVKIENLYTTPPAAPVAKLEPLTVDDLWQNDTIMSLNAAMALTLEQVGELADAITAAHNAKLGNK